MGNKNRVTKAKLEPHLKVYLNRSVLVSNRGEELFAEGSPSNRAKARASRIREALSSGFLGRVIKECRNPKVDLSKLSLRHVALLESLVNKVTSEVGRALVGLSLLQLCVKCICPDQSIRLHKGGKGNFSWSEGIPMRVLDKAFFTPTLREHGLLSLNADGIFMTRSLAENYPYTRLYKAALRGAREEWVELVEIIESRELDACSALRQLVVLLLNRSEGFKKVVGLALKSVQMVIKTNPSRNDIISFFSEFVETANYRARVFEVVMHSLFQVLEDRGALDGYLKPLSQMRSANKKHGNVGDIEITMGKGTREILEAWDAKFGKSDLREELEELNEKLRDHPETKVAGFVVDKQLQIRREINIRIREIEEYHGVGIQIMEFKQWARTQLDRAENDSNKLAQEWLLAFSESLCQMRRERAPIDEPADAWVKQLAGFGDSWLGK